MIFTISRRYSLDEYRAIKEKAEGRSEYRDGEIVFVSGVTLKYSLSLVILMTQKQDN